MSLPVAVTMGDPSGVGPELIGALAFARPDDVILVCGDADVIGRFAPVHIVDGDLVRGLNVFHVPCPASPIAGEVQIENAPATIATIEVAADLVRSGRASAMVTAPINKDVLARGANFMHPGHTEFLGHLDNAPRPVMMLAAEGVLRVVPVTIHNALRDVANLLTPEILRETIEITARGLNSQGIANPRIAVAGLNPHAGENGRMGDEELKWINNLLNQMRDEGFDIRGPLPADTMFHERARAGYDVAVCMYHDQALIPIKTLAFDDGVNVTLGLSFLRTSPDHGTAYDIAGQGIANPSSMIAAYDYAKKFGKKSKDA